MVSACPGTRRQRSWHLSTVKRRSCLLSPLRWHREHGTEADHCLGSVKIMGHVNSELRGSTSYSVPEKEGVSPTLLENFDRASSRSPATFWKRSFHVAVLSLMPLGALQVSSVKRSSEDRDDATLKEVDRFMRSETRDALQSQALGCTADGGLTEEQAYSEMLKLHS